MSRNRSPPSAARLRTPLCQFEFAARDFLAKSVRAAEEIAMHVANVSFPRKMYLSCFLSVCLYLISSHSLSSCSLLHKIFLLVLLVCLSLSLLAFSYLLSLLHSLSFFCLSYRKIIFIFFCYLFFSLSFHP